MRAHTKENVAPAIDKLRAQINREFPNRDKGSDGIWPSAAHHKANPTSDHENGNALDIDDDLSGKDGHGAEVTPKLAQQLSADPRCKYTIHDGVIYKNGVGRKYRGANKHETHIHVSVYESKRRDNSPWRLTDTMHVVIARPMGARKHHWWTSKVLFGVHRGETVVILSTASNGWFYVETATGKRGWVAPYVIA